MASTKRKRRHAREKALLTDLQEMDLLLGPMGAFSSDQERRECWVRCRGDLPPNAQAHIDYDPACAAKEVDRLEADLMHLRELAANLRETVGRTQCLVAMERVIARRERRIGDLRSRKELKLQ
jgi:hypothetical protein